MRRARFLEVFRATSPVKPEVSPSQVAPRETVSVLGRLTLVALLFFPQNLEPVDRIASLPVAVNLCCLLLLPIVDAPCAEHVYSGLKHVTISQRFVFESGAEVSVSTPKVQPQQHKEEEEQ